MHESCGQAAGDDGSQVFRQVAVSAGVCVSRDVEFIIFVAERVTLHDICINEDVSISNPARIQGVYDDSGLYVDSFGDLSLPRHAANDAPGLFFGIWRGSCQLCHGNVPDDSSQQKAFPEEGCDNGFFCRLGTAFTVFGAGKF